MTTLYTTAFFIALFAPSAQAMASATPSGGTSPCPESPVTITNPVAPTFGRAHPGIFSTTVLVTVNADGSVDNATIQKSSGYADVDQAVLKAARSSAYSPHKVNCKAVDGTYVFRAAFEPAGSLPPTPQPVISPTTSTGTGTCPETPAMVKVPASPEYPAGGQGPRLRVEVGVLVTVNPDGSVKGTSVAQSSGYPQVDASAVKAALGSTYKPATLECRFVEGTYLFKAVFQPGP